jgi:hypothetical protein
MKRLLLAVALIAACISTTADARTCTFNGMNVTAMEQPMRGGGIKRTYFGASVCEHDLYNLDKYEQICLEDGTVLFINQRELRRRTVIVRRHYHHDHRPSNGFGMAVAGMFGFMLGRSF